MLQRDAAGVECVLDFGDVDRRDEDVVADHGKHTIGDVESRGLQGAIEFQYPLDDRRKQMLVMNDCDNAEEHHQERGEGQRLFEGVAKPVFFGDAVKCSGQNDHRKANHADLGQVKTQREDQKNSGESLDHKFGDVLLGALLGFVSVVVSQDLAHHLGQARAESKPASGLQQPAGAESDKQHRHRHWRHADKKLDELPARNLRDQQILRLPDERAHAAERRPYCGVHHETAQEGAELVEV